jgi:hypothetical protein
VINVNKKRSVCFVASPLLKIFKPGMLELACNYSYSEDRDRRIALQVQPSQVSMKSYMKNKKLKAKGPRHDSRGSTFSNKHKALNSIISTEERNL